MMNPESTLEKANALMDRELNRPPRDPKVDAAMIAEFIEGLVDNKVPSELIKDLAIGYLMKI
jgi:hypothetical protein